jgi:hypothetical protein
MHVQVDIIRPQTFGADSCTRHTLSHLTEKGVLLARSACVHCVNARGEKLLIIRQSHNAKRCLVAMMLL